MREPNVRRAHQRKAQFDVPLLRRYDDRAAHGPCYPSFTRLSSAFGEADYRAHVAYSNGDLIPRHLSLYVHIPHCVNPDVHCSADCTVAHDVRQLPRYVENLRREIVAVGQLFDRDREILELHLGGGTPNLLGCSELADLVDSLDHHFRFGPTAQRNFSIALDPRLVQDSDIAAYAALGLNQARFGTALLAVNGFDSAMRRTGRHRSLDRLLGTIDSCHANGFRSVKLDVVYEAAGHSLAGFERLLDLVLTSRPDQLAFLPAAQTGRRRSELGFSDEHLALLAVAAERLSAAGYEYIGLDNFVLADHGLLRAQRAGTLGCGADGYTAHGNCDRIGLGAAATSHIGDSVSQNPADVAQWEQALDAGRLPVACGLALDFDDIVRQDVIQQVLCQGAIDIAATESQHCIEFAEYFAEALQKLQPLIADRAVECDQGSISVTSRGRPMLRIIAGCFDEYAG